MVTAPVSQQLNPPTADVPNSSRTTSSPSAASESLLGCSATTKPTASSDVQRHVAKQTQADAMTDTADGAPADESTTDQIRALDPKLALKRVATEEYAPTTVFI